MKQANREIGRVRKNPTKSNERKRHERVSYKRTNGQSFPSTVQMDRQKNRRFLSLVKQSGRSWKTADTLRFIFFPRNRRAMACWGEFRPQLDAPTSSVPSVIEYLVFSYIYTLQSIEENLQTSALRDAGDSVSPQRIKKMRPETISWSVFSSH